MFPIGQGRASVPMWLAVGIIDRSGLDYQLHSMGTVIEGEIDQVLAVVKQCFDAMAADCDRVSCSIKLDYRKGHRGRLHSKVKSVEENWRAEKSVTRAVAPTSRL